MIPTLTIPQISKLTLEEIDARLPASRDRLQQLQTQLAMKSKPAPGGMEMSDAKYRRWRDKLVTAHNFQVMEYRGLKAARNTILSAGEGPVPLLASALGILQGIVLLPHEQEIVKRIEAWLAPRVKRLGSGVVAAAPDKRPADVAAREPGVGISGGGQPPEE